MSVVRLWTCGSCGEVAEAEHFPDAWTREISTGLLLTGAPRDRCPACSGAWMPTHVPRHRLPRVQAVEPSPPTLWEMFKMGLDV